MRGSISSNSGPQTEPPEKRHGSAVDFSIYPLDATPETYETYLTTAITEGGFGGFGGAIP